MKRISLAGLVVMALVISTAARPTFDVRELGATGDGVADDTEVIQKALDECSKVGGGTVRLAGGTFNSRPLTVRTKTTLWIDSGAVLQATTNQSAFMKTPGDWTQAKSNSDFVPFLSGKDLQDVTIAGGGTIEGNGKVWWEAAEAARQKVSGYTLPRPNLIVLTRAQNLVIRDVTIQNSPKFHLVPTECDDVLITNVTILAPERAPNTDAIDPSVSRRVTITKCLIDVGDDNIAVKSGKRLEGREFACEDLVITNCTFKRGHGLSIGSETVGGVRNVLVRDCTFEGTVNGIRIKSDRQRGGTVENLLCENITMKDVRGAITITSYYPKVPATDEAQPVTPTTPRYKNLTIRNLTATSTRNAGIIIGLPESPVENVLLENVKITAAQEGLEVRHARGVTLREVVITAAKGEALITRDAEVRRE